jgi:hypothetical protein
MTKPTTKKTKTSGRSATQRMTDSKIDATAGSIVNVPVNDITFAPKGSALAHPREHYPINEALRDDIVKNGVQKPIKVRDDGNDSNGKRILTLVDGAQRTINGKAAQAILVERGLLAKAGNVLRVKVVFVTGSDAECLLERLRSNTDPLKVADSLSVLSATFIQLDLLGVSVSEMVAVAPKGIGPREIDALLRFGNLLPEVQIRFDNGSAPVGLLSAVLDASRNEQGKKLDELLSAGVKTGKGATRAQNKADGKTERPHPAKVRKLIAALEALPGSTQVEGIILGLKLSLGENFPLHLPKDVKDALSGVLSK